MSEFDKALEEALESPTLDEVLKDGKLLYRTTYDRREIEYNGKKYLIDFKNHSCIKFETLD